RRGRHSFRTRRTSGPTASMWGWKSAIDATRFNSLARAHLLTLCHGCPMILLPPRTLAILVYRGIPVPNLRCTMQRFLFRTVLTFAVVILLASSKEPGNAQKPDMVEKVTAALPDKAPAQPKAKRKILIFSKTAGFRHSSIAIGAKAIEMMGDKTSA